MWINTDKDLIKGLLTHGPTVLENAVVSNVSDNFANYLDRIVSEKLNYPIPITLDKIPTTRNWFIPNEYCPDLLSMLYDMCETEEQTNRVNQELELFVKHNMLDVLHAMKYIVDTLRANNIVWGVGRGSSVASYVLYLIGVHKVDSIKYNLPIEEFFKGDNNG